MAKVLALSKGPMIALILSLIAWLYSASIVEEEVS